MGMAQVSVRRTWLQEPRPSWRRQPPARSTARSTGTYARPPAGNAQDRGGETTGEVHNGTELHNGKELDNGGELNGARDRALTAHVDVAGPLRVDRRRHEVPFFLQRVLRPTVAQENRLSMLEH